MSHLLPRALATLTSTALLLGVCATTADAGPLPRVAGVASTTPQVTTTGTPVAPTTFASDDFERSAANGWGSAGQGGLWTRTGSAANFGASNGTGFITMAGAGQGPTSRLGTVASTDTDSTVTVKLDKIGNGGGTFVALGARQTGNSGYRAKVKIEADGRLRLTLARTIDNGDATLSTVLLPASATLTPQAGLNIRLQAEGTSPTTLRARLWLAGTAEPATWQVTATDSHAALQAAGGPILTTYLSGSSTNTPVTARFDGFLVRSIPVVKPPNIAPTAASTSSVTFLRADFDGTGSSDADGNVASYLWSFGDGQTSTLPTPSHTYSTAGTYEVKLTVTDNEGAASSITKTVVVERENAAPTATFTSSVQNLTAEFAGNGSADSDGTIASRAWSFGDGTTGSEVSPTHTYTTVGTFDVTLTITDNDGATDSLAGQVTTTPAVDTLMRATFDNLPTGVISPANFKATLGGTYGQTSYFDDTSIVPVAGRGNVIRTKLDAGTYKQSPAGNNGATLFIPLPKTVEQACMSYDLHFSNGFDWSLGGKLPGLEGVAPGTSAGYPTGGKVAGDLGWSGRLMWLGPRAYSWAGPTNGAVTYMYNPLQGGTYGDNVRWNKAFVADSWHAIKVCYTMNTVGQANGALQTWMDGQLVVNNTAYKFRNRNDVAVSHLLWHIFRGGADSNWAGQTDGYIDIDNFTVTSTS